MNKFLRTIAQKLERPLTAHKGTFGRVFVLLAGLLIFGAQNGISDEDLKLDSSHSGVWKGAPLISFFGKAVDSKTGQPINEFVVSGPCYILESCKTMDLGRELVKTQEGRYKFSRRMGTATGQTVVHNSGRYRVFGPSSEIVTFRIMASGYASKDIHIPSVKIVIDQDNRLDIFLNASELSVANSVLKS